ncbi:hypothetical protein [Bacteroides sp. MSB163]|uniref:hypothetical protein n=1 Tax=Bacteroides maternus TaxID=3117552 RepID=UPI002ED81CF0
MKSQKEYIALLSEYFRTKATSYGVERMGLLVLLIEEAINLIEKNSSHIKSAQDFLYSSDEMFTLSGICMQLIFIGESVKVLDAKTEHDYLLKYPME